MAKFERTTDKRASDTQRQTSQRFSLQNGTTLELRVTTYRYGKPILDQQRTFKSSFYCVVLDRTRYDSSSHSVSFRRPVLG